MSKYAAKVKCGLCGAFNEVSNFVVKYLIKHKDFQANCHFCGGPLLITDNLIWSKVQEEETKIEN